MSQPSEPGSAAPPRKTPRLDRFVTTIAVIRYILFVVVFFLSILLIGVGHSMPARSWPSLVLGSAGFIYSLWRAVVWYATGPADVAAKAPESAQVERLRQSNRRWKTVGVTMAVMAFAFFAAAQLTYKLTAERWAEAERTKRVLDEFFKHVRDKDGPRN